MRAPDTKVVRAVEVGRLAERGLGLGGGVADVVAGLEAADEADVGVDFVGLLARGSWRRQGRRAGGRGRSREARGGRW